MKVIHLQHADGHMVSIFYGHIVALQISTFNKVPVTLIQFSFGWSIPVIEPRETILKAIEGQDASRGK